MPVRFRIEGPGLAQPLRQIEQLVRRAGGRLWLVGGCVRDLMFERQPRDLDIEVSGISPGQLHAILTEHFSVQFVGRAFGVFKLDGLPIDVSLPMRRPLDEASIPGLLHLADPEMEIDEALSRRDFTVNAMAWDPDTLDFHDPFHGRDDLKTGTLRHVSGRFAEDPLRVLRGMQLAARFGLTAAPETLTLCQSLTQDHLPTANGSGRNGKNSCSRATPSRRDCSGSTIAAGSGSTRNSQRCAVARRIRCGIRRAMSGFTRSTAWTGSPGNAPGRWKMI